MAMKERTYTINASKLGPNGKAKIKQWMAEYSNERVQELPNGDLIVTWAAYQAGHTEFALRVNCINFGIELGNVN